MVISPSVIVMRNVDSCQTPWFYQSPKYLSISKGKGSLRRKLEIGIKVKALLSYRVKYSLIFNTWTMRLPLIHHKGIICSAFLKEALRSLTFFAIALSGQLEKEKRQNRAKGVSLGLIFTFFLVLLPYLLEGWRILQSKRMWGTYCIIIQKTHQLGLSSECCIPKVNKAWTM